MPVDASDLHISLSSVVPWGLSAFAAVVAAFLGLWNKMQASDIRGLKESIVALRESHDAAEARRIAAHEAQEKRFDERERLLRHEHGAALGVAVARIEAGERNQRELTVAWNDCRTGHERDSVRRSDFDTLRADVRGIFAKLDEMGKQIASLIVKVDG